MKSFLTFCFLLIAVFSFANVCEGADASEDSVDENVELPPAWAEGDSDAVDSVIEDIENEIVEAIAEAGDETEETSAFRKSLPLMFPGLMSTGKSQRTLNKDMAVKVASLVEQAALLVANDILQTVVLLQTDPADFLQANTTSTSE